MRLADRIYETLEEHPSFFVAGRKDTAYQYHSRDIDLSLFYVAPERRISGCRTAVDLPLHSHEEEMVMTYLRSIFSPKIRKLGRAHLFPCSNGSIDDGASMISYANPKGRWKKEEARIVLYDNRTEAKKGVKQGHGVDFCPIEARFFSF